MKEINLFSERKKNNGYMNNLTQFPMVSVIIPVYNAEDYISECLDSVLRQSLQDFEIICIDDGSTDRSYEILCEYAQHNDCIRLFQQKNQYAGVARNKGIHNSKGKYLYFLDADDFISSNLLEKATAMAESVQADIVVFSGYKYNTKTQKIFPENAYLRTDLIEMEQVFSRKDYPEVILTFSDSAAWTKLYRKEFVERNKLEFQPLPSANDLLFTKLAFAIAERIVCIEDKLIYYRFGTTTNAQSRKYKTGFSFMMALKELYSELQNRGIYNEVQSSYQAYYFNCLRYELNPYRFFGNKAKAYEAIYKDPLTKKMFSQDIDLSEGSQKDRILEIVDALRKWETAFYFAKKLSLQSDDEQITIDEKEGIDLVHYYYAMLKCSLNEYEKNCENVIWYLQYNDIKKQILSSLKNARTAYTKLSPEDKLFYLGYDNKEWILFESLIVDYSNIDTELRTTKRNLKKTEKQLFKAKEKYKNLKESRTYKVGKAVLMMPRKIKRVVSLK